MQNTAYDTISKYKNIVEQNIVDGLFDYFGRIYYKIDPNNKAGEVKNEYLTTRYMDEASRRERRWKQDSIWCAIFLILFAVAFVCVWFFVGNLPNDFKNYENYIYIPSWLLVALLLFIGVLLLISTIINFSKSFMMMRYSKDQLKNWNNSFYYFTKRIENQGIKDAIEYGMSDLILDKHTASYDRTIYGLHNRLYTYADIPKDARRTKYHNLTSGVYKNNPFTISYSEWEWFREGREINEDVDAAYHTINVNLKRRLHRFEDSMIILSMDIDANPNLNFILNNFNGKNIKLQNNVFNSLFNLVVNDQNLAYKVFTPYVQHTYSRLKTWSPVSKMIRQVIKEGNKLYVIIDGFNDFFKFNKITDPELNIMFNTSERLSLSEIKVGSLDETASLMTEYILEETDLLYTILELGASLPADPEILVLKQKIKAEYMSRRPKNNLFDIIANRRSRGVGSEAMDLMSNDFQRNRVSNETPLWNAQQAPLFRPLTTTSAKINDSPIGGIKY